MKLNSLKTFIKEGVKADQKQLRSRFFLFWFNYIPDLYLLSPLRNLLLRLGGADIPLFGSYIRSPFFSLSLENIHIAKGVFINKHAYIEGNAKVEIQSGCQIGPYLKIENTNHEIKQNMKTQFYPVLVEANSWIGSGVILLPKSIVKKSTIVAAGAVVSGTLDGNSTYGGVPAKIIKKNVL